MAININKIAIPAVKKKAPVTPLGVTPKMNSGINNGKSTETRLNYNRSPASGLSFFLCRKILTKKTMTNKIPSTATIEEPAGKS